MTRRAAIEIKGTSVLSTLDFVRSRFGNEGFVAWHAALSEESRVLLAGAILPSGWYPADVAFELPVLTACELFFGGKIRGAWETGRFSADRGLRGIYKVFVKLGSPGFTVTRAARALTTLVRPAEGQVQVDRDDRATVQILKLPDPQEIWAMRIGGFIERALEIAGAEKVTVKITKSRAKGYGLIAYEITW